MKNFNMKKIITIVLAVLLIAPVMLTALETSAVGIALIKKYEGCRLKAYKCPADVWTIGYGNTKFAEPGKRITKQQAGAYLRYDLHRFENYVTRVIPRMLAWHEYDALVSFSFNLGYRITGEFRTAVVSGNTALALYKIRLYSKARVRGVLTELRGLVRRRNDEAWLYENNLAKLDFFTPEKINLKSLRETVWRD